MYSHRIHTLSPSMTISISTLARELATQGKDILSFSAGEPDFDTPKVVKDEALKALEAGFTKYTSVAGFPELLKAIAQKLKRDNNLEYNPSEILVSNGAKHSLFNIFQAIISEGDEVIIPAPYWVTYPELVTYNGGKSVFVETSEESGFKLTPKQLELAITPKTKALILTTPSNPTGAVYSRDELKGLAEVLRGSNIWVISDEIYEKLVYGVEFTSVASISEDMLKRTITVNGLSKSAAMTGWRMGYLASKDRNLIKLMNNLQSQSTSNINSITQKASIPALDGRIDRDIEMMRLEFMRRRDYALSAINAIKGLCAINPQGAFYLFINIKDVMSDSMKFCTALLEEEGVALVPGVGFGCEGYVRFSFATSMENIEEGLKRLERFCKKHKTERT
ncbi:MAG: pyridoxal phosphate-dependent aminotransferase [Wolinella sp.]